MRSVISKTVFREIRRGPGRYLAIIAIVALGVGFFSGLRVSKPSMIQTADTYITEHSLYDFRLLSTLGFTGEDVGVFEELAGIQTAAGSITTDALLVNGEGTEAVYKLHSLTDGINVPSLTAGRMPQQANECLADARRFSEEDIGTELTISPGDWEGADMLAYDTYRITGLINSPNYLNTERGTSALGNGSVTAFLYLPEAGFDTDYYTEILLTIQTDSSIYSDEYTDAVSDIEETVSRLCEERAELRYQKITNDALAEITDAEADLQKAENDYQTQKKETEDALRGAAAQIEDGKAQLGAAAAEIEKREKQLSDGELTLEESVKQLQEQRRQYEEEKAAAASAFVQKKTELEQQKTAIEEQMNQAAAAGLAEDTAQLAAEKQQIEEALAMLESKKQESDELLAETERQFIIAESALEQTRLEIEAGWGSLTEAKTNLAASKNELNENETAYEQSRAEAEEKFAEAEAELKDAAADIEAARADVDSLKRPDCYTLTRESNVGYVSFENDASIVEGISTVFPLFFFMVAALVCMTTMTRMVEEQRTQIGVLKALGYGKLRIVMKYAVYSGSAAVIGCVSGFCAGSYLFPKVIWGAYGMLYGFASLKYRFDGTLLLISVLVSLLCSVGATLLSCYRALADVPAELIRPKTPKNGKRVLLERITILWKRLPFLQKVSIRNVLRYKKRMLMMILGVGGCTALLLTGLGVGDSIKNIASYQFDEITLYDISVSFSEVQDPEMRSSFAAALPSGVTGCLFAQECAVEIDGESMTSSVYLVTPEQDEISSFIDLHSGDMAIEFPETGEAVVSRKLAENLEWKIGDTVIVHDSDLRKLQLTVSGICDNYVSHYIYVNAETCAEQWGEQPAYKTAYLNTAGESDLHETAAAVMGADGVTSVSVNADMRERVYNMMSSMDYIVGLVIISAGALAFIVLYNLTNINITERIREIATIKVLGFFPLETAGYVFRENIILTVLAALIGLPLGKLLHAFVMLQINVDMVAFDIRIAPFSYILSLILTMVFTGIVSIFMSYKLKRIPMAESLKSIE